MILLNLAKQGDSWVAKDTINTEVGDWKFGFMNGRLDNFSLNIFDGPEYSRKTDTAAYILMRECLVTLISEAEKLYGADNSKHLIPEKFPGKSTNSGVYYNGSWEVGKNELGIILEDISDQLKPQREFHISVNFAVPN